MDGPVQHLTWFSIALAGSFLGVDAVVSLLLRLNVGMMFITGAIRCVVQLSLLSLVLKSIFESNSPWAVAGLSCLFNLVGAFEAAVNASPRRCSYMFPAVLLSMTCSTIPVSVITVRFIMGEETFWEPRHYIPVAGILTGATISGIVVSLMVVLREIQDNHDKVETYLSFGASRMEACEPIMQEALLAALMPVVNLMGVTGLITIPGTMTGAILGGRPVEQAAKLQIIILFCQCACTALGSIIASVLCMAVVIDSEHRIRVDKIDSREHIIWRTRDKIIDDTLKRIGTLFMGVWEDKRVEIEEHTELMGE